MAIPSLPAQGATDWYAYAQGLDADARTITAKAPIAGVEGVKTHDGTTGGGARPSGYARVRWVGGATRPTNMAAGDIWEHDSV